jgi:hypothetical protein
VALVLLLDTVKSPLIMELIYDWFVIEPVDAEMVLDVIFPLHVTDATLLRPLLVRVEVPPML